MKYDKLSADIFAMAGNCNSLDHARRELKSWIESDDQMSNMMAQNLMELVALFSIQGHSGFTASIAVQGLEKLLRNEPLGALQGTPEEWQYVFDDGDGLPVYQNIRCSRVFKDATGIYDISGKIFRESDGICFTSKESRVYVDMPYVPESKIVDVMPTD